MKLKVVRTTSRDSSVTVADEVFAKPNQQLLAQAVRVYLSNQRQGTSKTQTRSDVNRTTRKWYRQKGTGNARHGARDAALFVGGAVAHGPTGQENWKRRLTTVQKRQALAAALSAQVENIVINDELTEVGGKTKQAFTLLSEIIAKFEQDPFEKSKVLIVAAEVNQKLLRAIRNLPNVDLINAVQVNALDIAAADKIIFTSAALEAVEARLTTK